MGERRQAYRARMAAGRGENVPGERAVESARGWHVFKERGIVHPRMVTWTRKTAALGAVGMGVLLGVGCNKPTPEAPAPAATAAAKPPSPPVPRDLVVEVLRQGAGAQAQAGDAVKVHYVGTFVDGRKFESSRDRGEPYGFTLGRGAVMAGWDRGIDGMKVGEVRKLTVPPSLGYGASAVGTIPPNATLVFEVELVDVKRAP